MKFKEYLLKDIATITMGQSPKSQFYNEDGKGIEFLQGVRTFGEDFPYFDTYTTKYNRLAHKNSILFSVRAPVGRVNWATKNIAIGRGVASISVKDMVYDRYVYYYFKKMGSFYDKKATGTVFTSINKKELESLKIKIPASYDDQKRIADKLAILDSKIHLNQQLNANLLELASTYFQNFLNNIETTSHFLEEIATINAGGDKPKDFTQEKDKDHTVPIFSNGITNEGLYGYTSQPKIKDKAVTISARGTIGYTCLREEPYVPIVRLLSIIPKSNMSVYYLYLWLLNVSIQGFGTTQQQITVPVLKKYSIDIPKNINTIEIFNKHVSPWFDQIKNGKKENQILNNVRTALLNQMF